MHRHSWLCVGYIGSGAWSPTGSCEPNAFHDIFTIRLNHTETDRKPELALYMRVKGSVGRQRSHLSVLSTPKNVTLKASRPGKASVSLASKIYSNIANTSRAQRCPLKVTLFQH